MATTTAYDYTPANTAATMISVGGPAVQALIWKKILQVFEYKLDYFSEMEGGEDSIIETETDTAKGAGQYITFRTIADLYGKPKQGDAQFDQVNGAYEELKPHTYSLQVDTLRHGVSYNRRLAQFLGLGGEITSQIPEKLGRWLGWIKSEQMMLLMRELTPITNQSIINGKTEATLNSNDGVGFNPIIALKATMARQGGMPAEVTKDDAGNMINGYCFVSPTDSLYSLETDINYVNAVQATKNQPAADSRFKGGWIHVRGIWIKELPVVDHDGFGPIASPFNPKALLGAAITASSTQITLYGGGSAVAAAIPNVDYFRYFKNNPYQFTPEQILTPDNNQHYIIIVNPADGSATQNMIGFYSYNINNGFNLTLTAQLGPVNNGFQTTTLGSVTYNQGAFAPTTAFPNGQNTTTHPIGATIYQANAKGMPIGWSAMLGKRAMVRGYGEDRARRSDSGNAIEGGFIKQVFIESIFGQSLRQDNAGRTPGVFLLEHAINYAGVPIPVIT